jgi:hypothetical protein
LNPSELELPLSTLVIGYVNVFDARVLGIANGAQKEAIP